MQLQIYGATNRKWNEGPLYGRAMGVSEEPASYNLERRRGTEFSIPNHLRYEGGPFGHQGRAVAAWCDAGNRGILEMATGSGKTITSMICAHRLYEKPKAFGSCRRCSVCAVD